MIAEALMVKAAKAEEEAQKKAEKEQERKKWREDTDALKKKIPGAA